jgi:alkanesulfonate monooxygenase SsuD/methylene tetrahydromethanopterin reductase-like flavin-dependent oxidoreductase (luciferase family)
MAELSLEAPRFGFCVPIFANPGPAYFRVPAWTALEPAAAVEAAVEAERLGYDSVWLADHLMLGVDHAILEGWTTLSFIAGRTTRIKLGTIHLAQPFRAPSIAAKMAATLDALSDGRLIYFYDCGWQEAEVRAYGVEWPDERERIARMEEGLDLITALWTSEAPLDWRGQYFSTAAAVCHPRPVQRPRPPIWLGEARHEAWLDAIVRHADGWNSTPVSVADYRNKLERLRAACDRAGRNVEELELSLEVQILLAPTQAQARTILADIAGLESGGRGTVRADVAAALANGGTSTSLHDTLSDWLVGTPDDVISQLRGYMALGVTHFMLWFVDFPRLDGLRLFAEQVAPVLRGGKR